MLLNIIKKSAIGTSLSVRLSLMPERELLALKCLIAFFVGISIFYGIWSPSVEYKKRAEQEYRVESELLGWMKENEVKARHMGGQQRLREPSSESVLSVVDRSAKSHNLVLKKYEPNRERGIRIWLEGVQFNDLVIWLDELGRLKNIKVDQLNIDKKGNNGFVDARIELSQ